MTAAINALREALAVNRVLVRQATYGDYQFPFERHADLAQLETERVELRAGLRTLLTEVLHNLHELRGKPQNVAGLAVTNHGLLTGVDKTSTPLVSAA